MPKRALAAACAIAVLGLSACSSDGEGGEPSRSRPSATKSVSVSECRTPKDAVPGANPVETVKVLYPADLVFLSKGGWSAPGHAVVDVARDGKVVAEVYLEHSGDMWAVDCAIEGDFDPEVYPVPK